MKMAIDILDKALNWKKVTDVKSFNGHEGLYKCSLTFGINLGRSEANIIIAIFHLKRQRLKGFNRFVN